MFRKQNILLLACLVALSGCSMKGTVTEKDGEGLLFLDVLDTPDKGVEEVVVDYYDLTEQEDLVAHKTIMSKRSIVVPDVVGTLTVAELLKKDGDYVSLGDPVMTIHCEINESARKEAVEARDNFRIIYDDKVAEMQQKIDAQKAAFEASGHSDIERIKLDSVNYDMSCLRNTDGVKMNELENKVHQYDVIASRPTTKVFALMEGTIFWTKGWTEGADVRVNDQLGYINVPASFCYKVDVDFSGLWAGREVTLKGDLGETIQGKIFCSSNEVGDMNGGATIIQILTVDGSDTFDVDKLSEAAKMPIDGVSYAHTLSVPTDAIYVDSSYARYVLRKTENGEERVYPIFGEEQGKNTFVLEGLSKGDICLVK